MYELCLNNNFILFIPSLQHHFCNWDSKNYAKKKQTDFIYSYIWNWDNMATVLKWQFCLYSMVTQQSPVPASKYFEQVAMRASAYYELLSLLAH